ncbi:hypothetical protein CRG98_045150, partial [Punica granatum]
MASSYRNGANRKRWPPQHQQPSPVTTRSKRRAIAKLPPPPQALIPTIDSKFMDEDEEHFKILYYGGSPKIFQQSGIDYVIGHAHSRLLADRSDRLTVLNVRGHKRRMRESNGTVEVPKCIMHIEPVQRRSILDYQQQESNPFLKIVVALMTMVASYRARRDTLVFIGPIPRSLTKRIPKDLSKSGDDYDVKAAHLELANHMRK